MDILCNSFVHINDFNIIFVRPVEKRIARRLHFHSRRPVILFFHLDIQEKTGKGVCFYYGENIVIINIL